MDTSSTLLRSTSAYCSLCNVAEHARIISKMGAVYMERICPNSGIHSVKIAADVNWYLERTSQPINYSSAIKTKSSNKGCPLDCGICEWHNGSIRLPVFSITNDCNMNCSICFTYNRPDKKYYKTPLETKKIIDNVLQEVGELELINLTGGEPTLHPNLFDLLKECTRENIGRITMNTNGIKIADDYEFAKKIKDAGVQLVLSLDTLDPEKSVLIHGVDITEKKLKAIEVIEKLNIPLTILCVCIKNVNEVDVQNIVNTYMKKEFVKSITIQNMTYTGANGSKFMPKEHITIDEVENIVSRNNGFSKNDFFQLKSYHPLCYSIAYYIVYEEQIIPLTRLIDKTILTENTGNSYVLNPSGELEMHLRKGLDRLWAQGEDSVMLGALKRFIKELYPQNVSMTSKQRKILAEKYIKMLYIHSHMDAYNFDLDRIRNCGDFVPDEFGSMIPACSYNLLYRQKDSRFWIQD